MRQYSATLKSGNKTIRENFSVWIDEFVESESGLREWYGSFELPIKNIIEPDGPYSLELDDGRSGDILISNVQITSKGSRIDFRGTGALR